MSTTAHSPTPIPLLWSSLASKIMSPQRRVVVVGCYVGRQQKQGHLVPVKVLEVT